MIAAAGDAYIAGRCASTWARPAACAAYDRPTKRTMDVQVVSKGFGSGASHPGYAALPAAPLGPAPWADHDHFDESQACRVSSAHFTLFYGELAAGIEKLDAKLARLLQLLETALQLMYARDLRFPAAAKMSSRKIGVYLYNTSNCWQRVPAPGYRVPMPGEATRCPTWNGVVSYAGFTRPVVTYFADSPNFATDPGWMWNAHWELSHALFGSSCTTASFFVTLSLAYVSGDDGALRLTQADLKRRDNMAGEKVGMTMVGLDNVTGEIFPQRRQRICIGFDVVLKYLYTIGGVQAIAVWLSKVQPDSMNRSDWPAAVAVAGRGDVDLVADIGVEALALGLRRADPAAVVNAIGPLSFPGLQWRAFAVADLSGLSGKRVRLSVGKDVGLRLVRGGRATALDPSVEMVPAAGDLLVVAAGAGPIPGVDYVDPANAGKSEFQLGHKHPAYSRFPDFPGYEARSGEFPMPGFRLALVP